MPSYFECLRFKQLEMIKSLGLRNKNVTRLYNDETLEEMVSNYSRLLRAGRGAIPSSLLPTSKAKKINYARQLFVKGDNTAKGSLRAAKGL